MNELRIHSLNMALWFSVATSTIGVIVADLGIIIMPPGILPVWATVQALVLLCSAIKQRRPVTAALLWIIGIAAILMMVFRSSPDSGVLTFFSVWAIWCAVLFNNALSVLLLPAVWLFIGYSSDTLPAFLLAAACLFAVLLLNTILRHMLQTNEQYRQYAVQQMDNARDHRAHLARLTKALHEAKTDLERANAQLSYMRGVTENARLAKAQFAANVSHEIRTPINLIVGFSELLLETPQTASPELSKSFWTSVETIKRNSRHLQSLINDVLDMSQLDAGQMALMREEVDPRQVMLDTAALLGEAVERKGLQLIIELPETLPPLPLDRIRIRQVILNLLGNAIRFTDAGTITLHARMQDQHLLIQVKDTGIGIPQADLDRVFEEFHQLDSSMSRRYGGSGLGLTLSKRFIEQHDGQLTVESAGIPGEGSTFTICLPARPMLRLPAQAQSVLPYQLGGRYFVVYDQDASVRTLFERHAVKHRPVTTDNMDELIRLACTIHPSLIIVDHHAPIDAIRDRLIAVGNNTPLLTCPMPSGKRAVTAYGVTDYLSKPVTAEQLLSAVERLPLPAKSILIVDDDQEIVRLFSTILESHGYRARKAYSGREALGFMQRRPPDAVILDMMMPDMTGIEVVAAMRATPVIASVPVIMASATSMVQSIETGLPGELRLEKPSGFLPLELVGCIETMIDHLSPATLPVDQ